MQRSLELNERGVLAIKARDFNQAQDLFTKALEIDSRNITAVFNLAGMYITNKKEPQAVSLLSRYTKDFPKDAGLQARLGDAYFGSQDPKNATSAYEAALKLDPSYPGLPAKLGTLYAMQHKLDKAAVMYERAIKANPKDLQSLKNLSSIYLALKKPQQSVTTAKKALQISSSGDLYATLGIAYQELHDDKNALNAFLRAQEMGHKDPNLAKAIEGLTERSKKGTT
jgi:tetratricopeptide (TPR) repeat protein